MKICKECKYVQTSDLQLRAIPSDIWRCKLGSNVSVIDGITAVSKPGDSYYCAVRRLEAGACKPEGLQWDSSEESVQ